MVCVGMLSKRRCVSSSGCVKECFLFSTPIYIAMQAHPQTFHYENCESVCYAIMATAIHTN